MGIHVKICLFFSEHSGFQMPLIYGCYRFVIFIFYMEYQL